MQNFSAVLEENGQTWVKMSWSNGTYQEIFSGSSGQTMAIMSRYERTLEYGLYRALKELKEVQTAE